MRYSVLVVVFVLAVLAGSCGDDSGADSETLEVVIEALAHAEDGASGTFTASGAAVDTGLVFSAGDWTNVDFAFVGGNDNWFEDEMICADETGTFVLQVSDLGPPSFDQPWTGPWTVVRGTGEYEGLQGGGDFAADFSVDPAVETYTGEAVRG